MLFSNLNEFRKIIKKKEDTFIDDNNQDLKQYEIIGKDYLPTYKRNKNSGEFLLQKDKQLRLPGYADRILSRGYTEIEFPLNVKGNDHLPLFALLCFGSNCNKENSEQVRNKPITKSQPVKEVRGGKLILSYNINYT